jgi:hypothetical protein
MMTFPQTRLHGASLESVIHLRLALIAAAMMVGAALAALCVWETRRSRDHRSGWLNDRYDRQLGEPPPAAISKVMARIAT